MLNLKVIVMTVSLVLPASFIFAGEKGTDQSAAIAHFLKGAKLDKKQIAGMLDMLAASGQITKAQAQKAKKELAKKSDADIKRLQDKAISKVKAHASGKGLNSKQQKMIDDMKKRMAPADPNKTN